MKCIIVRLSKFYRKYELIIIKSKVKWDNSEILAIIGCGRSGTTFSSKILKNLGIFIVHERLLINGISSWYLISDQGDVLLGPTIKEINDLHPVYVHQVREYLAAISSIISLGKPSWKFLAREIPIDLVNDSLSLQAMKYYYYLDKKAERISALRVRSEFFMNDLRPILN